MPRIPRLVVPDYPHHVTRAEARADVFDYIEVFYNPRKRRKLKMTDQTVDFP